MPKFASKEEYEAWKAGKPAEAAAPAEAASPEPRPASAVPSEKTSGRAPLPKWLALLALPILAVPLLVLARPGGGAEAEKQAAFTARIQTFCDGQALSDCACLQAAAGKFFTKEVILEIGDKALHGDDRAELNQELTKLAKGCQ
ncbi:MAG: hypothetical protein U1E65_05745 [Myxococcota bacterium]